MIIAGAGGAAHLPGVTAAFITLPVIGVPVRSLISIDGWDSILSILQMPSRGPVATVALDAAKTQVYPRHRSLALLMRNLQKSWRIFNLEMREKVLASERELKEKGY